MQATPPPPAAARQVLDFWFGDGLARGWPSDNRQPLWFGTDAAQDQTLREHFGPLVDQALAGGLRDWENTLPGRLALVLLLDQLPRNLFRGQARAFAGDARAQRLALQAVSSGLDRHLPTVGRVFAYMPFMHAEDLTLQAHCVRLFQDLLDHDHDHGPPTRREALAGHLRYAVLHHDIVARFGRFPHRNAVLGRSSTAEEAQFLIDGPRFGQ